MAAMASSSRSSKNTVSHKFESQAKNLLEKVSPSVVAILSYFDGPPSREIPHSARRGTGVFVAPKLILTSAHLVALVSNVNNNCFLARTIAQTANGNVLCTKPVAVNISRDVAILEVIQISRNAARSLPPSCKVGRKPDEKRPLLGITRHGNCSVTVLIFPAARVGLSEQTRPNAPFPMENELEWVNYGDRENSNNMVKLGIKDGYGSPWFNFQREVVGVASWAAEANDGFVNSYSVPAEAITTVLQHAKNKGSDKPIVMDDWITTVHAVPDDASPIVKELVPRWPSKDAILLKEFR